jgi:hypothetical protein
MGHRCRSIGCRRTASGEKQTELDKKARLTKVVAEVLT